MFCNQCGKPNPEGSKYCSSCGHEIGIAVVVKPKDYKVSNTIKIVDCILIGLLLGLMVLTNPTMDDFVFYRYQHLGENISNSADSGIAEALAGAYTKAIITECYTVDNFYIFSLYRGNPYLLGTKETDAYIGVFKGFYKVK